MPCVGPSADEIASMEAHSREEVYRMLKALCQLVPDARVTAMPLRQTWWNNGKPPRVHTYTLDQLTNMLCNLCKSLKSKADQQLITKVRGLPAWWEEHQRLDRERAARNKQRRTQKALEASAQKKLAAAGLTDDEKRALGIKA